MKIFISGLAGFLGSHLADAHLARGDQVQGCDNLITGDRANVPEGACFKPADCADVARMTEMTVGADVIYHCAAVATEGLSVFSPAMVGQHTYQSTAGLLAAAATNTVARFVFCSSMARYGAGPIPFREDQDPDPEDPYGIAKVAAEALVRNMGETHGFEWNIAVPHNVIGPRQRYDDPYRNVAAIMINRMLQGRQPVIYGDGGQKRCFSFVQDCVDPLVRLGTQHGLTGEVFNIGPDDEFVTILELATTVADLLGFDLDPIYASARPREVRYATCSADKARLLLGYRPKTGLREGLQSMVDWIRTQGPRPFRYDLPIEVQSPLGFPRPGAITSCSPPCTGYRVPCTVHRAPCTVHRFFVTSPTAVLS
ncbi:MAG: NAD-dependent epimerase/dehydratase family protein [Gemmatimonadales bacterium]